MSQDKAADDTKDLPELCYLQVSVAGQVQPKPIVIRLHKHACPKTCRNFVALCTNNDNERTTPQRPIATYRGSHFHRIIPNFMCQAGDFERFDGTGGYSPIYHGGRFNDENLNGKHDQAGVVSMANAGKNTNKSQFFITLKATPHLDGKHVVFGQVVSGMESVHAMTMVEREGDRPVPLQRIVISDCGVGMGGNTDKDSQKGNNKSSRKQSKKKHTKDSKSKRRYTEDDDDSRRRDRKKRKKHRHSHREESHSVSSSTSSSRISSSNDSRGGHSRHRKKHSSRSKDRHERKKHRDGHGKRSKSSSKRKRHKRSDSRSSSETRSYSSDSRERQRDRERRRKHRHNSKH